MERKFSEQADDALARASMFGLLAFAFFDPGPDLVQRLADGEFFGALQDAAALETLRTVQASVAEDGPAASLKTLKVEYARLFIGPGRAVVSPYETIYASQARGVRPLLMVSPTAMAVEQAYQEAGVMVSAGLREPPDHFATESEFLFYLAQKEGACWTGGDQAGAEEWQGRERAFLRDHLGVWGREFCQRVETESRHPFYRAMAHCAAAFLRPGETLC